jgi:branched-chain amino acid transport system substrate-binding protein
VGLFAPLTGERAALGIRFTEGVHLYVDAINAKGGIEGHPIELQIDDTRAAPRESANIAQRLAGDPKVIATIGAWSSTESMAAAPILGEAHLVQVAPTASHPDYTSISPYQFRITNTQDGISLIHADMLVTQLHLKRIALLYFQDDWGNSVDRTTTAAVQALGAGQVQIVMHEAITPETRDFRALLTKIRSVAPDGVFIATPYAESAVFMQQYRQSGMTYPVAATDTLNDPKFAELAGPAADGIVMPTPFDPDSPAASAFTKAYEERFHKRPDYFSAYAHDAILVIAEAARDVLKSGKPLTRESLRDAIADAPPRAGVAGPLKFDSKRNPEMRPTMLITVANGAYKPYP